MSLSESIGGKVERMDSRQEDPELVKALERNDGDFVATAMELAPNIDD